MFQRERIPNYITGFRLIGALLLPWFKLSTVGFFILYSICGFSDIVDGFFARRWHVESEFGARLDSVSDLIFYSVMLSKVIPFLIEKKVHYSVWILAGVAAFIRLISYLLVLFKYHRFAAVHTYANKLTGLAVFSLPYLLFVQNLTLIGLIPGIIGAFASTEELIIHATSKEYNPSKKSILF